MSQGGDIVELPHELRLPFVKWVATNQVLDIVFSPVYFVFLVYDMMSICVKLSAKLFLWKDRLGLNDKPLFTSLFLYIGAGTCHVYGKLMLSDYFVSDYFCI